MGNRDFMTSNCSLISSSSQSPFSRCFSQGEGWSAINSSVSVFTESRTLMLFSAVSIFRPAMSGGDLAIAGRGQHALADVNRANAAHGYRIHIFTVAEHRNLDADLLSGVEDRRAGRHLDVLAVDRHLDHRDWLAHIE